MNRRHLFGFLGAALMVPWVCAKSIRDRYPPNDVRHWGAVCDGVTDDSEAFEKTLAYVRNQGGGIVQVGRALLSSPLDFRFHGRAL